MPPTRSASFIPIRSRRTGLAYLLLYVPVVFAWMFMSSPLLSFGIAWLGSWWILGMSMTGQIRPLPGDCPPSQQLLRPLFLTQFMFAGYFCLGSIFYVWDLIAFESIYRPASELSRTAAAQRYYVLGHAAFVHGLLATMDYRRSGEWDFELNVDPSTFFLVGGAAVYAVSLGVSFVSGLHQFVVKLEGMAAVSAIIGFATALREGNGPTLLAGSGLYAVMLFGALLSGWKHQLIFLVGLLLIVLFPTYKRTTVTIGLIAAVVFVTILPAYNNIFRSLSWQNNISAKVAAQEAFDQVRDGKVDVGKMSWRFLSDRLTTVSLFNDYIEHTPQQHPYHGFSIVEQSIYSVIPRVFWPSKPNTEQLVMQRVYENDAVQEYSEVSAKPKFIVDAYLSGGALGIFIGCLLLGCAVSLTSTYAEAWFGGYKIGGQVVYTSLFAGAWLTPSFEFLFNTIFWSCVLMVLLAFGLYLLGLLHRQDASSIPSPVQMSPVSSSYQS